MKHTLFSRFLPGLLLPAALAVLMMPAAVLAATTSANISVADKPVRIIRGTGIYKANVGVLAQKDDIVETGQGGAQLEVSPDLILAMGPDTRIYLSSVGADGPVRTELVLLKGWVKVMVKGSGAAKRLIVTSGSMKVALDSGSSIVHSNAEKSEMFAEEGTQVVNEIDERGKAGADTKVNREQFAINLVGQGLKVLPRPGRDFLTDMPVAFRDPVTPAPDRLKGARSPATKEREADFADVEPWLNNSLPVKKAFVSRFMPRIKDPAFRKQLDEQLGQSAEWKSILHPPPPAGK
ncbi:hypothetical protein [Undibacterium sp.]|uniref:hypothetical protein n=1 Tax=Undibacterium sp. TaxID=1914977 RepID=UPI00374D092E